MHAHILTEGIRLKTHNSQSTEPVARVTGPETVLSDIQRLAHIACSKKGHLETICSSKRKDRRHAVATVAHSASEYALNTGEGV